MYKLPGKYGRAIVAGILGVLIIGALFAVNVNEGRKLSGETNASSYPPPTPSPVPEGQLFGLFVLLILGTIFVIGMTGFFAVLLLEVNECNLKDAMLVSGLAGFIPGVIITMVTTAMAVYELLFLTPGITATTVFVTAAGIIGTLATFVVLDMVAIVFGVFALGLRKMFKKAN